MFKRLRNWLTARSKVSVGMYTGHEFTKKQKGDADCIVRHLNRCFPDKKKEWDVQFARDPYQFSGIAEDQYDVFIYGDTAEAFLDYIRRVLDAKILVAEGPGKPWKEVSSFVTTHAVFKISSDKGDGFVCEGHHGVPLLDANLVGLLKKK